MGKRRLVIGLAALLVMALGSGDALAQGGEPVTITGRLTVIEPESEVLVRVTAGLPVTVTLSSPDFDAVLRVTDELGGQVAFNDDNDTDLPLPNRTDSALRFAPLASELMVVHVSSFRAAATGAYTLTLQGVQVVEQNPVSLVQNASGNVVEGVLTQSTDRAARLAYSFWALAELPVTLTLTSQDFDTVLEVYDADGALVGSNDDYDADSGLALPRRTDSAMTVEPAADGLYTALVRAFEDGGGGRFTLTIEGAAFGPVTIVDEADEGDQPVCDNVLGGVVEVSSTFGGGYEAERLLDGDLTTGWSSRGDDEAPYLIFEVGGGRPVMLDGVVLDGFSSSPGYASDSLQVFEVGVALSVAPLESFTTVLQAASPLENALRTYTFPPVEARYVLLRPLTNYGGNYYQATEFNACTRLSTGGGLGGELPFVINGQFRPDQPYLEYELYALENAELVATLVSDAFDPVLEVYTSDGRRLADNDDHGPEFNLPSRQDAALRLTFTAPQMIRVRVRSFARGGPFTLTIDGSGLQTGLPEAPSLPPCRDVSSAGRGGAVVGFSSQFGGRWLAEYLIDDNADTGWASGPGEQSARPEYVILDLAGDIQTIASVRINPAATGGDGSAYNVSRFAVLVSTTDAEPASFTEVFSALLTERHRTTVAFDLPRPAEARYVMLETRDTFGGRWHEVAEFTVCAAIP